MGNPFKGLWKGLKWTGKQAAKVAPVVELLAPGTPAALAAHVISALTDRAETKFPKQGTGKQKSEWVTVEALKAMEILTGRNYDSPEGRALIQKLIDSDVAIKNAVAKTIEPLQAQYDETLALIQAYMDSVKAPAKDDTEDAA